MHILSPEFLAQNIVHLAAFFTLICFLFRDQIKLRSFAALGDGLLSVYYYAAFPEPLWNPMAWSILNVIINLTMILVILRDGRVFDMTERDLNLFRNLEGLTPGQFRKLRRKGTWHVAEEETVLTTENETPERLYYVQQGEVTIAKGTRRSFTVEPRLFIGELSLLRRKPATATARVAPGSEYIAWERSDLEKLFAEDDAMRHTLHVILSRDMAEKVANA